MKYIPILGLCILFTLTSICLSKKYYGYKPSKRKCYMCTYNTKNGWNRCEGPLTEKSAKEHWIDAKECDYNCYLKQDLYGNVERGCYAGEFLVNPNLLGCHWQSNELYCFCEGEKCNVQPKLNIKYKISEGNNIPGNQVINSGKGDSSQDGLFYGVIPTKASKRDSDYKDRNPYFYVKPTEMVRPTAAVYELVPVTKHGPKTYSHLSSTGYGRNAYNGKSYNKVTKYNNVYPTDDPKMYYTPLRTTVSSPVKAKYGYFVRSDANDIVDDDTNEASQQTIYIAPSKLTYTRTYPQQPVYVHELSSSSTPREEAYVVPGKEADPIQAPPVYEDDIRVGGSKLEPKQGQIFIEEDAKPLYTNRITKLDEDTELDKDDHDFRDDFSLSGSSARMALRHSSPLLGRSTGKGRYGQYKDGHSRGHYKDDVTFDKHGYRASKDIFAHTHSRDDSTKDEETSRHSVKDGGSSSKTDKHKFRAEVDQGERHKNLHFVDGDHLREHEEDHFVHKRNKKGNLNHKESHTVHKADEDYYKKKDRQEDHYKYGTEHRDVMVHRKTNEDSGSRGYDKKYGGHIHHSHQGNTHSASADDEFPFHFGGYGSISGSVKDRVHDVKENHRKYEKNDYYKLKNEEANGLQGSLTHVAGHNIKDHDEEGFDKKHKDHQDVLDERGDDHKYIKHGHSRHKGSFHRKHSVKDEYDRGRQHEGLLMAHQDYQTARDRRYNAAKGHVDEVTAHNHDKSSRGGDGGGHLSDHFGLEDRNRDHQHYDSDHRSAQSRDAKHKLGHGDLYKYLKVKDGEKGKNVNQFEDSLQYEKEHDVDIHRSPHETTEERHFKLRTRGRNSHLRLKEREDFSQIKQTDSKEGKHKKHYGEFKTGDGQMLRIADGHERAGHGLKTTILLSQGFHPVAP